MKLENQVVSLELAKRLKELGVKQESAFYWYHEIHGGEWVLRTAQQFKDGVGLGEYVSAFTVAELGEMLPARLEYKRPEHSVYRLAMEKQDTRCNVVYVCADCRGRNFEPMLAPTEADARAKMLIYLIENHLITV